MSLERFYNDQDPEETREWLEAFASVVEREGGERALFLLERLTEKARLRGVHLSRLNTPYLNTIVEKDEAPLPGDAFMERRLRSLIRWNALAMVMRANMNDDDLGGHIAAFASSAMLYDVGFNHFFRAENDTFGGDLIYYEGQSSPGMYPRSVL